MVFEGVLVDVLNHFLRPYVKNLDPSQLKVAIWSGDVLLENLELKENALDDLNLPICVFRGYLERLKLKIPWKNLYSGPITAEIDGLYVVAGPVSAFKYNAEKDEKEKRERKEKQLKRIEDARKKAEEPKNEKASQDPGFVEKLIANMIRNIQITVKNIHIRYEDAVTNPSHPFSFGITLDSLFVQSTDSAYVVGGDAVDPNPAAMLIYKLLQLNCLAVYWQSNDQLFGTSPPDNWMELLKSDIARPDSEPSQAIHYVVHPITLEAHLQLTTTPGRDMQVPQALVEVSLQQVALALGKNQFRDIMSLVESFDRMSINQKFLKYRPEVGVREGAREWWRYAISAVREEEVKRKLEMWSWKHMQQHRKWSRQYTEGYARKLMAKSITAALQKELEDLESKLDVFNLTICRQLAENKVKQKRRAREEGEGGSGGGGGGGWWGWATGWAGGSGEKEGKEIVHLPSEAELQEEKEKMYVAIGYSQNAGVPIYLKQYVAHKIKVKLEQVSVQLWNGNGTVAHLQTLSVKAQVQNRPSSKSITVQTTVGRIMARGLSRGAAGVGGEGPVILSSKHADEASLLDLSVDVNPVDSAVDQRLRLQLLPVQVVYHADTVDAAIAMFMLSKDVQLQRLSAAAASTLEELKTQGRAGLEHAISKRRLLDLDVVINSPCLVVPQNGAINESSCVLVADLGCLEIKSDLKSCVPDVREATDEELDEAFYDHFIFSLRRLQVLLAGPKQDWTDAWSSSSSPLHLLEPTSLELKLKKSLLPNDTRLPNVKVEGELPSLSLSLSDKKMKQLLQLVQSLPLPPPSLVEKRMESASSTYSIPDQPSRMDTDSIVGTISETLLLHPELERGSSEEYWTASDCESDEEGVLRHRKHTRDKAVAVSTTKLRLQFAINKIGILFSEHHDSSGHDTPRLHLLVTSMAADLLIHSWDMQLAASIGDLHIADHYITGSDGGPGTLLSTQLTDKQKFLTFSYSKFDPQAPHYSTEFKSTRQSIAACVSLLRLNVHTDSLLNLLEIGRSITTVMKTGSSAKLETQESRLLSSSSSSSVGDEGEKSLPHLPGEKDLQLRATLVGVEVAVCGSDVGEVMGASVIGLDAQVDMFHDFMRIQASMADVLVVDNDQSAQHKEIIHKVDEAKNIISLNVTLYKHSSPRDPRDLSTCDLDVAADVERVRVTVVFGFLGRVRGVVMQFLDQLKLDQTTIDSAREAASNTATRTAEALKERSSSRVKLNVTVHAPLLIIPYTPSPSPLSPLSLTPSSALDSTGQRAFVANLGVLTVKNRFRFASEMATESSGEREPAKDPALFLSPVSLPAVVDCMTVTISSVQLGRVLNLDKIGKSVSGDIHAKSHDASADRHALLWPLEFKGQIVRRLNDWCTAIPAVSVSCKIESVQMQFSPLDYQDLMCMLRDVKELTTEDEGTAERPTDDGGVSEFTTAAAAAAAAGDDDEGKSEQAKREGDEAKQKEEEEGTDVELSPETVSVHVEAVVAALELLLYSEAGEVAEVKVKGVAATVNMCGYGIDTKARISGVEVLDCSPEVLYHKIVSVEEEQSAVDAQVTLYSKGEGYYDTSKSDMAIQLTVNRIRVVALYLFVARILNYVKQLQVPESTVETAKTTSQKSLEEVKSGLLEPSSKPVQDLPKRIKLDISIRAPEITVPLSSQSSDIVVLDLGQLTLENEFLLLDADSTGVKSMALYEQHYVKLTNLEMYRSTWDSQGHKPTACRRGLLEPVTLSVELQRNLSAQWYHGIPAISVDAQLEPLQVMASGDDIECLCSVLNGNLKESYSVSAESLDDQSGTELTAGSIEPPKQDVPSEESRSSVEEDKELFTEFLVSVRLKSIGLKLYSKGQVLSCDSVSTWTRESEKEFTELVLKNLQAGAKKENTGALSASLTLEDCIMDDLRTIQEQTEGEGDADGSTRETSVDAIDAPEKVCNEQRIRRMIQKRETAAFVTPPLISLDFNLSQDNDIRLTTTVDGIQVLANLKFIQTFVLFLRESTKPLTEGATTDGEEGGGEEGEKDASLLQHDVSRASKSQSVVERERSGQEAESRMQISAKIVGPLIALLEDARQMDSAALVCQTEVRVDFSRKMPSNKMSINSSVTGLTLSTAKYPDLDKSISKPVLGPLPDNILAYMDQWDGTTQVSIMVPSLTMVLSPATVRLILNSVRSLDVGSSNADEVVETAPSDLWESKPLTKGPLKRKWFLKEDEEKYHVAHVGSNIHSDPSMASSVESQQYLWNENLEVKVANITLLIEQEVTEPSLRTFPALSLMMGKYSSTALVVKLQDWSSKLTASAVLSLEASYYNIRTDSWEPILEPIVDPHNEARYISWSLQARVMARRPPSHARVQAGEAEKTDDEEEEEEKEQIAGLNIDVHADSALQLTVTRTSLSIFSELVQAYTEKKVMAFEEVDTPETYDAAFTIVNKLGRHYPVTIKPSSTLKVHGAYSPILHYGDNPLPLQPLEGVMRMKPGELLPRDSHLSRIHIVNLQIASFAPLNVTLGMYERVYYALTSQSSPAADDDGLRAGIVVHIDRTAGTPVVTLRSPLQVYNHLQQSVTVYHSATHAPPVVGVASSNAHVPAGSTVPLPLDTTGQGYLYFQLQSTGMSQPAVSWKSTKSLDIACALTRSEKEAGGHHKQSISFIHSQLEVEEYSRTPSFSLAERAHHTVHLHYPLVVHNLLPYSIALGEEGHSLALIGSGCQASISYTNLSHTHKFLVEVEKKDKKWSGDFTMGPRADEETLFTVSAHDSSKLELTVKKEEKGTWQLSVFSRNWMVNKTGLNLQYKAAEGFFGQRSTDVFLHNAKNAISLFPHEEVCVRVVKGDRYSEWSSKFSLKTLGSEGVFSCLFKDSSEVLQIGTRVDMSKFGTTRLITLSPFYMINNGTRDDVSFREHGPKNSKIYAVRARELLPFWPGVDSEQLVVAVGDDIMARHSAPFKFTETNSLLIRTGSSQQQLDTPSTLQKHKVPALEIEIQVTGSANIVTFTPYYPGCVPLQLVNHTAHTIDFKQSNGPLCYSLPPSQSLMYTWDLPLKERHVICSIGNKKIKLSPQDGGGSFSLPTSTSSAVDPEPKTVSTVAEGGVDEVDAPLEDIEEEPSGLSSSGEEKEDEEGEELAVFTEPVDDGEEATEEVGSGTVGEADSPAQRDNVAGGTDEVDFSLKHKLRGISKGVGKTITSFRKTVAKRKPPKKRDRKGYWISFMDGLQRVVLFTNSSDLKKRVLKGSEKEPAHTELTLSLIGTGLSLVDDTRGQEVAYIGIPQSQKEWQIRVKKMWKALPPEVSEKIEQAYDANDKSKDRKVLPDSDYEVDFNRMNLHLISKGTKNKLRRSHFEGVYARVTLSKHLTSISLRVSHVQIDNQLPLALNPIILYPYPPHPSVALKCAPKPFIEGTIVIHKTEQSNINQIQYLQVLIQELGVNVDMSFLMALLSLLSQVPSTATEAQIVERDVKHAKLPLKESKVAAVSAAVSRNYFKYLHLSPLVIHLSFSLELSQTDDEVAKKVTERNMVLRTVLNILTSFATLIGKTKDAELQLRYFQVEDVALTQQALVDRISKHYIQEGAIQMYRVVLGLEVLGNPVGFVKGLKEGAVGLFYHPIQGAVLGPDEFLEGMKLGGKQFVGGTIGGISGVLGKVTGVLGDTAAKLTMDDEFVAKRRQGRGGVGQGLEGAAKGVLEGVTGVFSQPIKGAKKEGLWGLVKGTGRGVLGLVLRPTGGLIDLTSATFNAVQKKTKVGDYEVSQLRPPRFIGHPKFVSPYSPHKAEGYALFLAVDKGKLMERDMYFDHIELVENPLKVLLITSNRIMVIKYSDFFARWEDDWKVMLKEMCNEATADKNSIVITVLEEQGGFGGFLSTKKKARALKSLKTLTAELARKAVKLVNQAYQEYSVSHT